MCADLSICLNARVKACDKALIKQSPTNVASAIIDDAASPMQASECYGLCARCTWSVLSGIPLLSRHHRISKSYHCPLITICTVRLPFSTTPVLSIMLSPSASKAGSTICGCPFTFSQESGHATSALQSAHDYRQCRPYHDARARRASRYVGGIRRFRCAGTEKACS